MKDKIVDNVFSQVMDMDQVRDRVYIQVWEQVRIQVREVSCEPVIDEDASEDNAHIGMTQVYNHLFDQIIKN